MKWNSVKDQAPPKESLIVLCNICKNIHIVMYDYDDFCLVEACTIEGYQIPSITIQCDYWMPLPPKPDDSQE